MFNFPAVKTVKSITQNLIGYAIIALSFCVITLFLLYRNSNTYIQEELSTANTEMRVLIDKNNGILYKIQIVFINNDEIKRLESREKGEKAAIRFIDSLENESNKTLLPKKKKS